MTDITLRHPNLWSVVTDADGDHATVGVPDESDEHRARAAALILDFMDPDWIVWTEHRDECIAAVAPILRRCELREHTAEPWHEHDEDKCGTVEQIERAMADGNEEDVLVCKRQEGGCGTCEDAGWVCEGGDGPAFPYLTITRSAMDHALEPVRLNHAEALHG